MNLFFLLQSKRKARPPLQSTPQLLPAPRLPTRLLPAHELLPAPHLPTRFLPVPCLLILCPTRLPALPITCPQCSKTLRTEASLLRQREHYCRYCEGKRARKPAVTSQSRSDDDDDDVALNDDEFQGETGTLIRTHCDVSA